MAKGHATGWIEWQGETIEFTDAIAYAEKNWGTSFPSRWFWIQGNDFTDYPSLSVTAAAGERWMPCMPWAPEMMPAPKDTLAEDAAAGSRSTAGEDLAPNAHRADAEDDARDE